MFGLFGGNELKKLQKRHKKTMQEAFELSKIDRTKSDAKYAEAAEIEKEIIELEKKG